MTINGYNLIQDDVQELYNFFTLFVLNYDCYFQFCFVSNLQYNVNELLV